MDDFSTGTDPYWWRIYSNSPLYAVDVTQGDVRFRKPVGGAYTVQYVGISFRPSLRGDFDVSVDFRDANITRVDGTPGNQVQLNVYLGNQAFLVVRSDEVGAGHNVHVWLDPPGTWAGARAMPNTAGRLRVQRRGIHAQAWFDNILIYEADHNSDDARVQFVLQNNRTRDATSVTFDDFAVSAEELLLPAPALAIERSDSSIMVSWPLPANDWLLHTTTNLVPGAAWTEVPPPYQTNAAKLQFIEPSSAGNKFYRLHKP